MKHRTFFILFIATFLLLPQLIAEHQNEDANISIKRLHIEDEQKLYNSLKRVFFSAEHKNIIDTDWSKLHITKRVTTGFINIDVETQNILIKAKSFKDSDEKEISVEIYTTLDEDTTHYNSSSFLHRLFWNRVEFILGINDEWIDCHSMAGAFGNTKHLLCTIDKQKALKQREQKLEP